MRRKCYTQNLCIVLQECIEYHGLAQGGLVHARIISAGHGGDLFLNNRLIDMYAKCGSLQSAQKLFNSMPNRNLFTWNTLLSGLCSKGLLQEARHLFDEMSERDAVSWNSVMSACLDSGNAAEAAKLLLQCLHGGVAPSAFTFSIAFRACSTLRELQLGRQLHAHVVRRGFCSNPFVVSAAVDFYAKWGLGFMADCWVLLQQGFADVASWTAFIGGCVKNGLRQQALRVFLQMRMQGIRPNQFTYACVLDACADAAALEHGKQVHGMLVKSQFRGDVYVCSALVDMYSKCGCISDAEMLFWRMQSRDLVLWTMMISGYAQNGQGREAVGLFRQMLQCGIRPNDVTFTCLLSACSHAGLLSEGIKFFDSMSREHGLKPTAEHYACMIDLFGRTGRLHEAQHFIASMPIEPPAEVWRALLAASRNQTNLEVGIMAAEHLFRLEPENPATFVQLSGIYAAVGRWEEAGKFREALKGLGFRRIPGCK